MSWEEKIFKLKANSIKSEEDFQEYFEKEFLEKIEELSPGNVKENTNDIYCRIIIEEKGETIADFECKIGLACGNVEFCEYYPVFYKFSLSVKKIHKTKRFLNLQSINDTIYFNFERIVLI